MLTAKDGRRIALKAGTSIQRDRRKHERVSIVLDGQLVGSYGIQRSSREKDYSYIASQLGITSRQARDFARCPLSVKDLISILREKGWIS